MNNKTEKSLKINTQEFHATAVAINKSAILILGESGSGKSDLALRLIDKGAILVGDDRIIIEKRDKALFAYPHDLLKGLIEVRGVGIVKKTYVEGIKIALAIQLGEEIVERMPKQEKVISILDVDIPIIALNSYESSSPIKVLLALENAKI